MLDRRAEGGSVSRLVNLVEPPSLFDLPQARTTDPESSHKAARTVSKLAEKRAAVLAILRDHPVGLTDTGIASIHHTRQLPWQSPSGLRTRRNELVELGLVQDSGRVETTASGRQAIVWQSAP